MIAPNVRTPGHSIPLMLEDAISGRKNICEYAGPNTRVPMIYIKDAAKAAIDVLDAPKDKIKTMNYNVTGIQEYLTLREIETYLKKRYPGFEVTYKTEGRKSQVKEKIFSHSYAQKEWGWSPQFSSLEAIVEQFEKDFKQYPKRYGILS
jgi:nucleoside-diphosphate-sugar epimerase